MCRMFFLTVRKLIIRILSAKQPPTKEKLKQLASFNNSLRIIFSDWFTFLSTCIRIGIEKHKTENILIQHLNSFPKLLSEEDEHQLKHIYSPNKPEKSKPKHVKLWPDYIDFVKNLDHESIKKISCSFETDEFINYFLNMFPLEAEIMKRNGKMQAAYHILFYGCEIAKSVDFCVVIFYLKINNRVRMSFNINFMEDLFFFFKNPNILFSCARINVSLATLYFEFGKYYL